MDDPKKTSRDRFLNTVRQFNKYFFNRIILLLSAGKRGPFSILTHTGRRTGRIYRTPVLATYIGDSIWIPLSYGKDVDWLKNVIAQKKCELMYKSQQFSASGPRLIPAEQALAVLPEDRRQLFQRFKLETFLCLNRE